MEHQANEKLDMREFGEAIKKALLSKCQLLRIDDVSELTTLGKSTIHLWTAQNRFVKPIVLSETVKVWELQSILDWIAEKKNISNEIQIGESK